MDVGETFKEYLDQSDWRVKENSNCTYSFGGLNKHVVSKASALYWERIYNTIDKGIMRGHRNGDFHIHDLGSFSSYCFGASIRALLEKGIYGIANVARSAPAKHFGSICAQIANIATIFQNENAGAIAFSSVNVYLAPFMYNDALQARGKEISDKKEKLTYTKEELRAMKQAVQNMVFALNSNCRQGSECVFSNFTLDFKVLSPMKKAPICIGGKYLELCYGDFQEEADIFTKIFVEVLKEGDGDGKLLPYPIPTFNVSKDMDWENYDEVFELAAATGSPYFGNFLHGSLKEEDIFSMCCRLRLDKKELANKTGGLFGAGEQTGSCGVFTINLPAIGHSCRTEEAFFDKLDRLMELGYKQLEAKRALITAHLRQGLYPALKGYMPREFTTFFSSFGLVGAHEMCLNFIGKGIDTEEGTAFTLQVIRHMKSRLQEFQSRTDTLFNLEYTPAESTAFRLAMKDLNRYPSIIHAGSPERPYYTNSTHLPVDNTWSWEEVFRHQEKLLPEATGGSVYHCYLDEATTTQAAKHFIRTTLENFNIPYLSLSPRYSVCNHGCGVLKGEQLTCPKCGGTTEVFQRVTGYIRRVSTFNDGKAQEYIERFQRKV